jgi:hypothetical protein
MRPELGADIFVSKLQIIVDLAIGDERRSTRAVERLIAGLEVDDREPRLHQTETVAVIASNAVGATMAQRRNQPIECAFVDLRIACRGDSRDAAHQFLFPGSAITCSKISI